MTVKSDQLVTSKSFQKENLSSLTSPAAKTCQSSLYNQRPKSIKPYIKRWDNNPLLWVYLHTEQTFVTF